MNSIELLKNELIAQKTEIENKGGNVVVSNNNPSPSEITAGIKSIVAVNLNNANATEEDVAVGKTFFAGSENLKTGTLDVDKTVNKYLNTFFNNQETEGEAKQIIIPEGVTSLKPYCFNLSSKTLSVTLNSDIEEIGEYAFNEAVNIKIENFSSLQNLKRVGTYGFRRTNGYTVNLEELPDSIEIVDEWGLGQCIAAGQSIRLPANLAQTGNYAFAYWETQIQLNKLIIPSTVTLSSLSPYMFYAIAFDDDLVVPSSVTTIESYFNHRGSFNNVTIPATCTTLLNSCFYGVTTDPNDWFKMKSVVFESETPPSVGRNMFAKQHLSNGLKIYVPDNAVSAYKAISNFKSYGYDAYVYPMSQRP